MRTYTIHTEGDDAAAPIQVRSSAASLERLLDDVHVQTKAEPKEVLWRVGGGWAPLGLADCNVPAWTEPQLVLKIVPVKGLDAIVAPDVEINFVGRERLVRLLTHVKLDKQIAGHAVLRVRDGSVYRLARLRGVTRDTAAGQLQLFLEIASGTERIVADFRSMETVSNKAPSKAEIHHWVVCLHNSGRRVPTKLEVAYSESVVDTAELAAATPECVPAPQAQAATLSNNSSSASKDLACAPDGSRGSCRELTLDAVAPALETSGSSMGVPAAHVDTKVFHLMVGDDPQVTEMRSAAASFSQLFDDIHAALRVEPKAVLRQAHGAFMPLGVNDCGITAWPEPCVLRVQPLKGMEKVVIPEMNLSWVGRDRLMKLLGDPYSLHGPNDKLIAGHAYLRLRDGDSYALGCLRGVMRDTTAGVKLFVEVAEAERLVADLRSMETVSNKPPGREEIHHWATCVHGSARRIPTELEHEYSETVLRLVEAGDIEGGAALGARPAAAHAVSPGQQAHIDVAGAEAETPDEVSITPPGGQRYGLRRGAPSQPSPSGALRRRLSADLFANVDAMVAQASPSRHRHLSSFANPLLLYPNYTRGGSASQNTSASNSPPARTAAATPDFTARGAVAQLRRGSLHSPPAHGDVYEAPALASVTLHPRTGGGEQAYLLTFTRIVNQPASPFAGGNGGVPSARGAHRSCAAQLMSKHYLPVPYTDVDVTPKGTAGPGAQVAWHGLQVMCYERWGKADPRRQFFHLLSRDGVHWGAAAPKRLYRRARAGGDARSVSPPRWSVNDRRRSSTPPPSPPPSSPAPSLPYGCLPRCLSVDDEWGGEKFFHLFWVEPNPAYKPAPATQPPPAYPGHTRARSASSLGDVTALSTPLSPDTTCLASRAGVADAPRFLQPSHPHNASTGTLSPRSRALLHEEGEGAKGVWRYIVKHAVSTDPELERWRSETVLQGIGSHDAVVGMSVTAGVPDGLGGRASSRSPPATGRRRSVAPAQGGVTLILSTMAAQGASGAPAAPQCRTLRKSRTSGQLGTPAGYLRSASPARQPSVVAHTAYTAASAAGSSLAFSQGVRLDLEPRLNNPAWPNDAVDVASDCSLFCCPRTSRWHLVASCVTRASAPYSTVLAFTSTDHRTWTAADFVEHPCRSDDESTSNSGASSSTTSSNDDDVGDDDDDDVVLCADHADSDSDF
eukprot:TRINITY_DN2109_c0_g2_i10.p1 TRINITY_DN2109_c0_g2~~TRINITY_DN2109_c0_g2_i10.p1  ORF type:complete len:1185 (+),score=303.51 TRINITY_DN2109_c0_g2_i10:43-3597(+)